MVMQKRKRTVRKMKGLEEDRKKEMVRKEVVRGKRLKSQLRRSFGDEERRGG